MSALHFSAAQLTSARQPPVGSPLASQVDASAQASASVMHFAAPHFSHSVSSPCAQVPPPLAELADDVSPVLELPPPDDDVVGPEPVEVAEVEEVVVPSSSPPQPTAIASEVTPARTNVPKSFVFMCSASSGPYHRRDPQRD